MYLPTNGCEPLYILSHVLVHIVSVHNGVDLESHVLFSAPITYILQTAQVILAMLVPSYQTISLLIKTVT